MPRDNANIVPYKLFAAFATCSKVSPRRDEGIPPYRTFYCLLLLAKYSVENGLDRSSVLWQYRIILSADTASEVRQLLGQKRR